MPIVEPQPNPELKDDNSYTKVRDAFKRFGFNIIKRAMQSSNFVSGSAGWKLTAEGNLECNSGTFRGTLSVGTSPDWFRVDTAGNIWSGNATLAGAKTSNFAVEAVSGLLYCQGATIGGGVIDETSTIDGRTASILATAIDASGHFADTAISTATQTIIGDFTFTTTTGGLQIGTYVNGDTGDIRISESGILGRDSSGATTFSINATTGVAVLNGLVVGTNVGIGTAEDSAGVTTIVGNVVTTGYVNALNITAQYVAASISITSPTITGGTIQTAASGLRTKMYSSGLWFGNDDTKYADIVVTYNAGDDEGEIDIATSMSGLKLAVGQGASPAGIFELGASSVGISAVGKSNLGAISMNFGTGTGLGISWSGGDTSTKQIDTDLRLGAHWLPHITGTYDLGSTTPYYWRHLYLSGNIVVGGTVDGTDIASHVGNSNAHHAQSHSHSSHTGIGASDHHSSTSNNLTLTPTKVSIADPAGTSGALNVNGNFHLYTGAMDIKNRAASLAWAGEVALVPNQGGGFYALLSQKDLGSYTNGSQNCGTSSHKWNQVWATNGTIQTSTKAEKKDIESITYGMETLKKLNPVNFKWKKNNEEKIGLIGEEVQKIIPEVVYENGQGINYSELVPVLISSIKELNNNFKDLENRLKKLENK